MTVSPGQKSPLPTKHVPLRRCVSCGRQLPQRELIRIVRTAEGKVAVDQGRKKAPGRGAYLCHERVCWEKALQKDRLSYALKGTISLEDRQRLQEFAKSRLPQAH